MREIRPLSFNMHEHVELAVAYRRAVQHIVIMVMLLEHTAQVGNTFLGIVIVFHSANVQNKCEFYLRHKDKKSYVAFVFLSKKINTCGGFCNFCSSVYNNPQTRGRSAIVLRPLFQTQIIFRHKNIRNIFCERGIFLLLCS